MSAEQGPITATIAELQESKVPTYHLSGRPIISGGGAMDVWQSGEHKGRLGFNSYWVQGRWAGVQYLFCNGGPSSPSCKYHGLGIGGLMTAVHTEDGHVPSGDDPWRYGAELNFYSAITKGDLLTIDPFGTGKSWARDPSWACTMSNDVGAIAAGALAFRRALCGADVFVPVLSSFAAYRSGIVRHLRQAGVGVPSMVILGGSYDSRLAQYTNSPETADSYALRLPAMALAAQAHNVLGAREQGMRPADLFAEVTRFALDTYAPQLQSDKLTPAAQAELVGALASYTGLTPEWIADNGLYIHPKAFRENLLPGQMVSAVDTRLARPARPERIDIVLDEWELAYGGLLSAGAREGFFPKGFAQDYEGIIQASSQWKFDDIWTERRMHECMERLIQENRGMTIVDIAGMYELIRPAPMSQRFWNEMHQRTGVAVRHHPADQLRYSSSLDGITLEPGVHGFTLAMGHQVNRRYEHARGHIGALLYSLGDAAAMQAWS